MTTGNAACEAVCHVYEIMRDFNEYHFRSYELSCTEAASHDGDHYDGVFYRSWLPQQKCIGDLGELTSYITRLERQSCLVADELRKAHRDLSAESRAVC